MSWSKLLRRAANGVALIALIAGAGCNSPLSAVDNGVGDMGAGGGDPDMVLVSVGDFATTPSTLTIAPISTSLAFGQSQPFIASRPVNWSVVEAGGGQIDANGRYTAPSAPGI